jgi:hypothetical protein
MYTVLRVAPRVTAHFVYRGRMVDKPNSRERLMISGIGKEGFTKCIKFISAKD